MDNLQRQHRYAALYPYPPPIPPFEVVAEPPWPVKDQTFWRTSLWEDYRPVDPTDPWSEVK